MPFATTPTEQHLDDVQQRLASAADAIAAARAAFSDGRLDDALSLIRRLSTTFASATDASRHALATAEEELGRRLLGADRPDAADRLCRSCGRLRPVAEFIVPHTPKPHHACAACRG